MAWRRRGSAKGGSGFSSGKVLSSFIGDGGSGSQERSGK